MARYDWTTTTVETILADPEVIDIMERWSAGITTNPMIAFAKRMTLDKAFALISGVDPVAAARARAEIEALD